MPAHRPALPLYVPLSPLTATRSPSHNPASSRSPRRPVHLRLRLPLSRPRTTPAMSALPPGVSRTSIPFLIKDMVTISDPALVRRAATHADLTRPADASLPWFLRFFFQATKFIYPRVNRWALPMLSGSEPDYPARRAAVEALLAKGFSTAQRARLSALVAGSQPLEEVEEEVIRVFSEVLEVVPPGEQLPAEIVTAARQTITGLSELAPPSYLAGRAARRKLEDFLEGKLAPGQEVVDYVHNLAATTGFSAALVSMRERGALEARPHFLKNPVLPRVLRAPKNTTTLDGILPEDAPLEPGALVALAIGPALVATGDDNFFFGAGVSERQCPFKELFFDTVKTIDGESKP